MAARDAACQGTEAWSSSLEPAAGALDGKEHQAPRMTAEIYSLKGKRVWVAGHRGMVGSAILRRLAAADCACLTVDRATLDLTRQAAVEAWLAAERPDLVILAAAKVGGILANDSAPGCFLHDNLAIQTNVIHGAWRAGVEKLLFFGSSCVYPKLAPQPMPEDCLLTAALEPTNEWYAVAKIAGLKLCQAYRRQYGADFISVVPCNLYGPGDNFDLNAGHVVPALLRKMHEAKLAGAATVEVWGSGRPRREFLFVDDLADAVLHLIAVYSGESHINVGCGSDGTIAELAATIKAVVGFQGEVVFDSGKPDGTPRKLLDVSRLTTLGWHPKTALAEGLRRTYEWFLENPGYRRSAPVRGVGG